MYVCVYRYKKTIYIYTYIYLNIHKKNIYTHTNTYIYIKYIYTCTHTHTHTHTHVLCCAQSFSCVQLFVIPQTIAHQALLSTGFSRQESWSGWPCPPPGDLPKPGIEPRSSSLQADSLPSEPPGKSGGINLLEDGFKSTCYLVDFYTNKTFGFSE